jgi:PIN domain nuclease of toxin-antitoxin system
MILLDTHTLFWWTIAPDHLSAKAAKECGAIRRGNAFVSAISIWELGVKAQRGKLDIGMSIAEFAEGVDEAQVEILPVDLNTWLKSIDLSWEHRDPADRVIAATALLRGLKLVTKDDAMAQCPGLRVVW